MELRKVLPEDAEILFVYRNEEETRKNSKTQDEILWENHIKWFQTKLNSNDCKMYMAIQAGKPIGQIRADIEGQKGIISYSIDKPFRGMGYGKKIIRLLEQTLPLDTHITFLQAEVKPANQASIKCFAELDYQIADQDEEILVFEKFL